MPRQAARIEDSEVISVAAFMLRKDGSVTCHFPENWSLSYQDMHEILYVLEELDRDEKE